MNDVDFIVLDVDGGEMLRACIDSILAQSMPPHRVVIFDNASRVPASSRLTPPPNVEIIRSDTNLGFAGGANEAFRRTSVPFVAFVNNDVVLDHDWLASLRPLFDGDPRLAAAQTINRRDERAIDGAGIDISDGTFRQIGHGEMLGATLPDAWGVSATAAIYRRGALGDRPFDPRFFAYYEDVELSARLREAGWRIVVVAEAKASHRGSASASVLGDEAIRLRTRNRYWVARMHPGTGRVGALLREDLRMLLQGRSSLRGMMQGLLGTMNDER